MEKEITPPSKEDLYGLPSPGKTLTSALRYALSGRKNVMGEWAALMDDMKDEIENVNEFREMERPVPAARTKGLAVVLARVLYFSYMMVSSSQELQPIVRKEFVRLVEKEKTERHARG